MTQAELERVDPDLCGILKGLADGGWTRSPEHASGTVFFRDLPSDVRAEMMQASRDSFSLRGFLRRVFGSL